MLSTRRGSRLANPQRDAALIADTFTTLGYQLVRMHNDLGLLELNRALSSFRIETENFHTAVIYFAGHGLEIDGVNRLLPVDAELDHVARIRGETINLRSVQDAVQGASTMGVIILDACRDNPFIGHMDGLLHGRDAGGSGRVALEKEPNRSIANGLKLPTSIPNSTSGMLVAFAAAEGQKALDGPEDGNSPYATALAEMLMTQPNLDVRILLGGVAGKVYRRTNGAQDPAYYNGLRDGDCALWSAPDSVTIQTPSGREKDLAVWQAEWTQVAQSKDMDSLATFAQHSPPYFAAKARVLIGKLKEIAQKREAASWGEALQLDNIGSYERYLVEWPSGRFADPAQARIEQLEVQKRQEELEAQRRAEAEARRETASWREAERLANVDSYQRYLAKWPSGRFVATAQARIEQLEAQRKAAAEARRKAEAEATRREAANWSEAERLDNIASYDRYLAKWPRGRFAATAREKIEKIKARMRLQELEYQRIAEAEARRKAEAADRRKAETANWGEAERLDNIASYERYLAEWPRGRFAAMARERIEQLKEQRRQQELEAQRKAAAEARRKAEAEARREAANWGEAERLDNIASYERYLAEWPRGRFAAMARERIEQLKEQRRQQELEARRKAEAANWSEAERLDSIGSYDRYLAKWPRGRFAATAREKIEQLKVRKRRQELAARRKMGAANWSEAERLDNIEPSLERHLVEQPMGSFFHTPRSRIDFIRDGHNKRTDMIDRSLKSMKNEEILELELLAWWYIYRDSIFKLILFFVRNRSLADGKSTYMVVS